MLISGVIYGFAAWMMIAIGLSQLKSEEPVGFYTGERPPRADEISDVQQWNREHGRMWILYGVILVLSWLCGCMLGDGAAAATPWIGGVAVPLGFMVWRHHRLIAKYRIK